MCSLSLMYFYETFEKDRQQPFQDLVVASWGLKISCSIHTKQQQTVTELKVFWVSYTSLVYVSIGNN